MKWNSNNTIRKAILNRWGIHQHRNQIQVFSERNLPGFQLYLPLILKQIVSKYLIERTKVGKESSAQQNITYEPVKRTHNVNQNHSGSWRSLSKGSERPRAISLLGEILLCCLLGSQTWRDRQKGARSRRRASYQVGHRAREKAPSWSLTPRWGKHPFPTPGPGPVQTLVLIKLLFLLLLLLPPFFFFVFFLSVSLLLPSHSLSVFRKHQPKIPFHLEQTEDSHFKNP